VILEASWQRNAALGTAISVGITKTSLAYRQYSLQIKTDLDKMPLFQTNTS
jgi:hypothetical protein